MSNQIKIVLVVGIISIVGALAYLLWPVDEEEAAQRGVSMDDMAETTE